MNREIIAENLVKHYDDVKAVDGVSFKVKDGEVFGFLGPNGAGKSTTVNILTTLGLPSSGRGSVGGYDIVTQSNQVRKVAGVALQEIGLDSLMTSMELLTIQGQLFGMSRRDSQQRARQLLEIVGLADVTERRVGKYSGGMRRRLDLAMALVHEPRILFLDEPTTGLDPASRRDVWGEVRRLNKEQGMTIFLTTQYLEEADELANRIAIINHGKIAVEGQPHELKAQLGTESINLEFETEAIAQQAGTVLKTTSENAQQDAKHLRLYLKSAASAVPTVVNQLSQAGIDAVSLTLKQPTLDDVFLHVTGERFSQEQDAEVQHEVA